LTLATDNSSNIVRNSDGTFGFCDVNADKHGDGIAGNAGSNSNALITAINGSSVTPANEVINQPIPSNGTMTVTVDSSVRNTRTRLVVWQDKNNNGQVDLVGSGDVNCDTTPAVDTATEGAIAISGRKFWFGPQGQFGAQFPDVNGNPTCQPVYRHDSANQVFSAGPTSATSLRYYYDSNDIFQIQGTQVTLATFKSELTASSSGSADTIKINYDPNPAGISTFNICVNAGATAPNDLAAAIGNFDSGGTADDVRLTWTAPGTNTVTTYNVQRALNPSGCTNPGSPNDGSLGTPASSAFTTIGAATVAAGEQGTFTNFDVPNGTACYRIQVTNPNTGINSYSNYVSVTVPGTGDTTAPTSTSATLTASGGFANTLDSGDKLEIIFTDTGCTTCGMSIAPNATIRVTDSDCGPATNAGPAACTGGNTNTVADIICGTNATCTTTSTGGQTNNDLVITMTANPSVVSAGSTAGAQFPVVVTDSSGITDLSGNAWNFAGSADRVFP
jgi:hypothetical protein